MVYYLKINRKEEYTFQNLKKWLGVIYGIMDAKAFIICDDAELEREVRSRISSEIMLEMMESERNDPEVRYIVQGFANKRWENAGYAHTTTFYHARENGFKKFWNIDADDTFVCLPDERVRELFAAAEDKAVKYGIPILSLDMWYTKSMTGHWTFGITYTDNSIDWFRKMKGHIADKEYGLAGHPPNMDGYFTYLRSIGDIRIESFYAENLRFLHYSNDFFRRPWASGFYHWKNGKLSFPVLRECFGIEHLGMVDIPREVIRLDMDIRDEEAREAMIENCYKADREDLKFRYQMR